MAASAGAYASTARIAIAASTACETGGCRVSVARASAAVTGGRTTVSCAARSSAERAPPSSAQARAIASASAPV